jgi:hypothetical protein
MNRITNISAQTLKIYETLIRGKFINDNSVNTESKQLYNLIDKEFDLLYEYFSIIGIELCKGDGYFYFSKETGKNLLEKKIERAYKWIDLLDFFKTFNSGFTPGTRFTPAQVAEKVRVDVSLEEKLKNLQFFFSKDNMKTIEKVNILINALQEDGFVEQENKTDDLYKVLSSFRYLEELVTKIEIEEPEENELPE